MTRCAYGWLPRPPLPSLAVRIQHHPSRAPLLPPLAAALAPLPLEVVSDPGGLRPSAWRSYRACLAAPLEADWLLVLQDDAIPCQGFAIAVAAALAHAGDHLVALFTPATALTTKAAFYGAQLANRHWCEWNPGGSNAWVSVVALAWPAPHVQRFTDWADARGYGSESVKADDHIVGQWVRATRQNVLATVPSLVEHPDDIASIMNRSATSSRRALAFASEGVEGVDWRR